MAEIKPLTTLDQLLEWRIPDDAEDEVVNVTRLCSRSPALAPSQMKTLVCHDMKGGYLDDRFLCGSSNKDAYRFYNWAGVDTFVYFSHHLVTVPPPCWINTAHQHGVKVLGTFITEWEPEGVKVCNKFLDNGPNQSLVALQLSLIANFHSFDGWLINIENDLQTDEVECLLSFVRELCSLTKKSNANSEIIWYDSVTIKGELKWQNELNDLNSPFFEACDGIFLNYTWTKDHLCRSRDKAGIRLGNVYVGIDVFGRNFYEGGGFNTNKAIEMARSFGLSVAIFAQAWTYETQGVYTFEKAEKILWSSLIPYLTFHGPDSLPFQTSFCQGYGQKLFRRGQIELEEPWHNLSRQQYQPIWLQENDDVEMNLVTSDAFHGGGCMQLSATSIAQIRIFTCSIKWRVALLFTVTYKWQNRGSLLDFVLKLKFPDTEAKLNRTTLIQLHCETSAEEGIEAAHSSLVVSNEENGWSIRTFSIQEVTDGTLTEVAVVLNRDSSVLLGQLEFQNLCIKGLCD